MKIKFVKYLRDFDVEPIVYIPENPHYPIVDKSFEKEVLKSYCNNATMPEDVEVISLTQTEDVSQEDLEERAEGKNWAYVFGSEEMTDAFGADRSPSIVIIDKDGIVTFSESGPMTESELKEKVDEALE